MVVLDPLERGFTPRDARKQVGAATAMQWLRFPAWVRSQRLKSCAALEDGQALVECALTFTVLMSFFFVFLEICLIFYTYCMTAELAREGTRYAALHGSTCTTASQASCTASVSAINSYVSGISWPNLGGGALTPSASFPDGNETPGSRVKITVSYVFPIGVPFVPAQSVSMASTSETYILQ